MALKSNPRDKKIECGKTSAPASVPIDCGDAPIDATGKGNNPASAKKGSSDRKVKLWIRLSAFALTVITLSWFFEGTRQIQEGPTVSGFSFLFFGTTLTVFLLFVQGFWIYIEEKSKGTLMRKVKVFDNIEATLYTASVSANTDRKRGDIEHRD